MKRVLLAWGFLAIVASAPAQLVSLPTLIPVSPDTWGNGPLWKAELSGLPISVGGQASIDAIATANGATMGGTPPAAIADMIAIRVIYFGETADRALNFGFTRGAPTLIDPGLISANASARTLGTIEQVSVPTLSFWDIPVTAATFSTFDLWMNVPGPGGGLTHAFHRSWDFGSPGSAHWSTPFVLRTADFDTAISDIRIVERITYLLSFEDGLDPGSAADRSDLMFGIQIIREGGGPGPSPSRVPEPTSFGILGVLMLASVTFSARRFREIRCGH